MPGATLESVDGDEFTGKVKVKVGPIQVTYNGKGTFAAKDEAARRAVIEATGKEARGSGTAKATITAQLLDDGAESTKVTVTTDLAITGRPAQFGRGVMVEVGNKLLGLFADCLADELGATPSGSTATGGVDDEGPVPAAMVPPTSPPTDEPSPVSGPAASSAPTAAPGPTARAATAPTSGTPNGQGPQTAASRPTSDTIDLLDIAGPSVAKRLLPVAVGLALLLFVWAVLRRRGD
jgi:carbon monoxide dehydrogenase subunit G